VVKHKVFNHSIANPQIVPERMFSSHYFEGCYPWYIALAFWGDGLIDKEADQALDSFKDVMLSYGYLDAHNFVAGNGGGWSEWIGYSSWHPRTHLLNVDAWRTATGENFIVQKGTTDGNAIKNYPKFIAYAIDPHKYFDSEYTYVRMGGAETTDTVLAGRSMQQQLALLPQMLYQSGLGDEAGLIRHVIETYEVPWPKYEHYWLYTFLGVPLSVKAVSPEVLQLPKSLWAKNLSVFFARSGFNSASDGVFTVSDGHFGFEGHRGPDDWPGFTLAKFGTLVNTRCVAHRGYGNLSDYSGGYPHNVVYFQGNHQLGRPSVDSPSELKDAVNGVGNYDHGGIEQISRKDGHFYHVRVNRSRQFQDGVHHSREYVWLPGGDPNNDSDFLVVYDRTSAPSEPEWVYHVPWKPTVFGYSWRQDISTGSGKNDRIGDAYSGSNIIVKELNSLGGERDNDGGTQNYTGGAGAHGVSFSRTILPDEARVEVTRVASFDDQALNRQHHLAIKSHRWQVSVKPTHTKTDHRFLHVFQTAAAEKKTEMVSSSLMEADDAMQGVFIEREASHRSNYVVLFNREEGINNNVVAYTVNGQGNIRHVISGLKPYTIYKIEDMSNSATLTSSQITVPDMDTWDYKGVSNNTATGVLYFETSLNGNHSFKIMHEGEYDLAPPSKPGNLKIRSN
jgi:hypothetical protein